jgi:hypothetical protein
MNSPPSLFLSIAVLVFAVASHHVSAFLLSNPVILPLGAVSSFTLPSRTQLSAIPPEQMRVAEIKAELKERRVGFADCFDKESLASKLVWARNNPTPPPPPPAAPPRAQPSYQQRADFGAESDMNSEIDMDVFAAAGWSEDQKKPSSISPPDHDRSPGLNRNFDEIATDDFKKPYYG